MKPTKAPAAVVIFRVFKREGGEPVALFPTEPYDRHGFYCMSYQHTGQHGGAMPSLTSSAATRPATPEEAAPLAAELRALGYRLDIRTRRTAAHDRARLAEARRLDTIRTTPAELANRAELATDRANEDRTNHND